MSWKPYFSPYYIHLFGDKGSGSDVSLLKGNAKVLAGLKPIPKDISFIIIPRWILLIKSTRENWRWELQQWLRWCTLQINWVLNKNLFWFFPMSLSTYTREFGTNLKLAYPVIVGMLGHTVVQLIDNIMVGQLGTAELAAVSLGNSFVFVAMSLGIGFSTAITPMIAIFGAKNHIKVRYVFVHGLILCFGLD